ncbi:MAG: CDP-glucose 4,6-dehydratase [Propionibacteriaceae bacterium]|nr:CDP-glucose 4,6-dehydratase [Propionibacteriaceae bacterium]
MQSKDDEVAYLRDFYRDKTVLLTGIHGFKGSWMALLLAELGAKTIGVGLHADDGLLFPMLDLEGLGIESHILDIRDRALVDLVVDTRPDVIFHMAAQPIVSVGHDDPYLTYSSNVMGVVNLLDGVRGLDNRVSVVNVTTDKCYQNVEKEEPYLEDDRLMGEDPYSSSKSCAELVSYSYRVSYFDDNHAPDAKLLSTARAGNVIGGGDFALNRIIPDMARALAADEPVTIRNFDSIRPYEHVLDALYAYVVLAARQWDSSDLVGAYNIGPNTESVMRTRELTDYFAAHSPLKIVDGSEGRTFKESILLSLDSGKFRRTFDWTPTWAGKDEMLAKTLVWYQKWIEGDVDMTAFTTEQVREFLAAPQSADDTLQKAES